LPHSGEHGTLSLDKQDIANVTGALKPDQVAGSGRFDMTAVSASALAL
jgi:hypothetical protein